VSDRLAELVARGLSPEDAAKFAAGEAKSAAQTAAALRRLVADLATFPTSPTLNAVAVRDDSGRVAGTGLPAGTLAAAYLDGAPAALVVQTERLDRPGRGCPLSLAHLVRATNAALAWYLPRTESGRPVRVLATVTVLLPTSRPATAAVVDRLALIDARVVLAAVLAARDHDPDPPPMEAAATASVLRTGPPAYSRVRPRQAALQLDAGTHSEGREAAFLAA